MEHHLHNEALQRKCILFKSRMTFVKAHTAVSTWVGEGPSTFFPQVFPSALIRLAVSCDRQLTFHSLMAPMGKKSSRFQSRSWDWRRHQSKSENQSAKAVNKPLVLSQAQMSSANEAWAESVKGLMRPVFRSLWRAFDDGGWSKPVFCRVELSQWHSADQWCAWADMRPLYHSSQQH